MCRKACDTLYTCGVSDVARMARATCLKAQQLGNLLQRGRELGKLQRGSVEGWLRPGHPAIRASSAPAGENCARIVALQSLAFAGDRHAELWSGCLGTRMKLFSVFGLG